MFTVKHVDEHGNETIYGEVVSVRKVAVVEPSPGDPLAQDSAGIKFEMRDGSGVHYGFQPPSDPRRGEEDPRIYVMNEAGATVATYRL